MNNNSLNNGVIPYQLIQRHQHNSTVGTNKKGISDIIIIVLKKKEVVNTQ